MFSKSCEYGIRAAIYIAEQSLKGRKTGLAHVAKAIDSPEAYTSKILRQIAREKIIRSEKGPNGGFSMSSSQLDSGKLSDIIKSFDGDHIYKGCALGLKLCDEEKPCPLHHEFKGIRTKLKNMLETTYIRDLASGLEKDLTFLKL